jgi:hypothetical protein
MKYDLLIQDGKVIDPGIAPGLKDCRVPYGRPGE